MIVEMRTYSYRPGTVAQALDRIALGLKERTSLSPLAGLWSTESGQLHQIVHLWPFADLADRDRVRGQFSTLPNWPARTGEFMEASETKILKPAAFSPPLEPREAGPIYEICTDTYRSGQLKAILDIWGEAIGRRQPSSLIGAWHTDIGPMNQWIHIWAYRSYEQWAAERPLIVEIASRSGKVDLSAIFAKQESVLCRPAAFSPLQ
jgi:hypothetical protein